ncbi:MULTISPECIES: ANTAR domain-containing protein [unclassified Knoellia]|uniref:ANTAR domain-containing protein n=1 Tax=Knoellia altitudinis TaxID=3404795 RepID=UPI00362443C0
MGEDRPSGRPEVQEQLDELRARADAAEERAGASESRADKAELRANDSDLRADAAERRRDAEDARSKGDRQRLTDAEKRLDLHEEMIGELQAEGLISTQQAAQLEIALGTARTIGMAVGITMTSHSVSDTEAFELLRKVSMDGNRRLRLVAEEVVLTGDAPTLRSG